MNEVMGEPDPVGGSNVVVQNTASMKHFRFDDINTEFQILKEKIDSFLDEIYNADDENSFSGVVDNFVISFDYLSQYIKENFGSNS